MMYFLTVGFKRWDGYAVYNDPEVRFFIFKGMLPPPGENFIWLIIIGAIVAAVAIVLVVFRKKVRSGFSRLKQVKLLSKLRRRTAPKEPKPIVAEGSPG